LNHRVRSFDGWSDFVFQTGRSTGQAVVVMSTNEEAAAAQKEYNGAKLDGQVMQISIAPPREGQTTHSAPMLTLQSEAASHWRLRFESCDPGFRPQEDYCAQLGANSSNINEKPPQNAKLDLSVLLPHRACPFF
jgi:RNA recognition motif-containing protein